MLDEDVIRFTEPLKLGRCLLISWVFIWMSLLRELLGTRREQSGIDSDALRTCLYVVLTTSSDEP